MTQVEPSDQEPRVDDPTLRSPIFDALRRVQEPELGRDIVTLNMVKGVQIDGSTASR